MPDPQTTNLSLYTPAHGADVDTWEIPVNANWNVLDAARGGTTSINVTSVSGTTVLTATQYQKAFFSFTGTLTANCTYQIPSGVGGMWVARHTATGAFNIIISSGGAGTSVTLSAGQNLVYCDGTNVRFVAVPSTPGGSNTYVQYNSSGAFAGSANLTFDGTTLTANALVLTNALPIAQGGTGSTTAPNARTALGLGTIATQDASAVSITGGTITGITALTVSVGGTGVATLTSGSVLVGAGSSPVTGVAPGSSGNVLTSNGSAWTSAAPSGGGVSSINGQTGAVVDTTYASIGSYVTANVASSPGGTDAVAWTVNSTYNGNLFNASNGVTFVSLGLSGTWRAMGITEGTYSSISGGLGTTVQRGLFVRVS